jgi:hypothetical protein
MKTRTVLALLGLPPASRTAPFWMNSVDHPRTGLAILQARKPETNPWFSALLAIEQPDKEDGRADGQDVKETADDAADGDNEAKTDGERCAQIKPATAISELVTICCRFSLIGLSLTADVQQKLAPPYVVVRTKGNCLRITLTLPRRRGVDQISGVAVVTAQSFPTKDDFVFELFRTRLDSLPVHENPLRLALSPLGRYEMAKLVFRPGEASRKARDISRQASETRLSITAIPHPHTSAVCWYDRPLATVRISASRCSSGRQPKMRRSSSDSGASRLLAGVSCCCAKRAVDGLSAS